MSDTIIKKEKTCGAWSNVVGLGIVGNVTYYVGNVKFYKNNKVSVRGFSISSTILTG